jgi:multidrug efflux pump subunit AcrA (membrane-fusion protein)
MFAKVKIITERKDNIVKIPAQAVINRFGEQYVFAVEKIAADEDEDKPAETVVRKKIVVPGILIDGVLEIQQGLSVDEEIVVRGQTLLEDGTRVNVVEQVAPLKAN